MPLGIFTQLGEVRWALMCVDIGTFRQFAVNRTKFCVLGAPFLQKRTAATASEQLQWLWGALKRRRRERLPNVLTSIFGISWLHSV